MENISIVRRFIKSALLPSLWVGVAFLAHQSSALAEQSATEQPAAEKEEDVNLKGGVVASTGQFKRTHAVDAHSTTAGGNEESPVTGRIAFEKDKCVVTMTNQSAEDSYSVRYVVRRTSKSGATSKKSFSSVIRPKGSVQKRVSCDRRDNVQVEVKSGKKL